MIDYKEKPSQKYYILLTTIMVLMSCDYALFFLQILHKAHYYVWICILSGIVVGFIGMLDTKFHDEHPRYAPILIIVFCFPIVAISFPFFALLSKEAMNIKYFNVDKNTKYTHIFIAFFISSVVGFLILMLMAKFGLLGGGAQFDE